MGINDFDLPPLKANSLADQVEEKLMQYLKKSNLAAGTPLPKESELTAALGVSRNILREALSRLRMLGIIESKKRKGMVLKEPELLVGVERVLDPSILGDDTMQDVFELRLVLEVGMADLIFRRMKKEDIDDLTEIAERENNDPGCVNLETRLKYEIEFHSKLYQMSGNKTLTKFQTILLPVFNYMMKQETKNKVKPTPGKITHDALVETLRNGTPAEFRVNMREHLSPHYKSV